MAHPRALGFVAVTLCLVACVCAHAAVSKKEAEDAVKGVNQSALSVLLKAQEGFDKAEGIKQVVEEQKKKTEKRVSQAETVAKGNAEAAALVKKAKTALEGFLKLHPDAMEKAESAFAAMKEMPSRAEELVDAAEIAITPDANTKDDYSEVKTNATNVKKEVEKLEREITGAQKLLEKANPVLKRLADQAGKVYLPAFQVFAIVGAADMYTTLTKADSDMQLIEKKRDEVNAAVEAIRQLLNKAPKDLTPRIDRLLKKAQGELREISRQVHEAQEAKKDTPELKKHADDALAKVKAATDQENAWTNLRLVDYFSFQVTDVHKKIKKALKSANVYAANANRRKQEAVQALSEGNGNGGGKKSTPGANDDSVIIGPFSLLLAFIACAVIH